MKQSYIYEAKVIYVLEGGLYDMVIDTGFYIFVRQRVRPFSITIPSLRSTTPEEKVAGRRAKDCAMKLLLHRPVLIETFKEQRYDSTWSANIYLPVDSQYTQTQVVLDGISYTDAVKYLKVLSDNGWDTEKIDIGILNTELVGE